MDPSSPRFRRFALSRFAWELEAIEALRDGLPDRDPYRLWSNLEFVASDGSVNEVDAVILAPRGLFLVEIKSRQGLLRGDVSTWTWRHDGRDRSFDNPLLLANLKAKRLRGLLERAPSLRKLGMPFVNPAIYLSARDLVVQLEPSARSGVYGPEPPTGASADRGSLPSLVATLLAPPSAGQRPITPELARAFDRGAEEVGLRPSDRMRRVGDYRLEELLSDGRGYQDWRAVHSGLDNLKRRIRIYSFLGGPDSPGRAQVVRAAKREFRLLQGIEHPGFLRVHDLRDDELGPALIFEDAPDCPRLDHYLAEHGAELDVYDRLALLRELSEILAYAHGKRLYHRVLSPASVLVVQPGGPKRSLKVFNWQTGLRRAGTTTGREVSGTRHPEQLADFAAQAYMAPEVRRGLDADLAKADVFSLGAIAWELWAGRPAAATAEELLSRLAAEDGLSLAAVVDGAPSGLDALVRRATAPRADFRLDSVADFLELLNQVEDELTRPDRPAAVEPDAAQAGDLLEGGFHVVKRLGQGSTAYAFLVTRESDGRGEQVLKVARGPEQNRFLDDEAEVLRQLRHHRIVELYERVEVAGRTGLLLARAGTKTLAEELKGARLGLELFGRYGEDLLETVRWLEEKGISHRDLKPANLGIDAVGPSNEQHLVLFDFSLSRAPAEKIHLGTPPYLDPFLLHRQPPRWDLAAERFAAAVTLYEMATGKTPVWGDGKSDPAFGEEEVSIEADRLSPAVRESLAAFFVRALANDPANRFDHAGEMLRAFRRALEPAASSSISHAAVPAAALTAARPDTPVVELGLSPSALEALERQDARTAGELLKLPVGRLKRLAKVGAKTRRELLEAQALLARHLGTAETLVTPAAVTTPVEGGEGGHWGVDRLARRLLPSTRRHSEAGAAADLVAKRLLGLDGGAGAGSNVGWPTQTQVAAALGVSRARVSQQVAKLRERWEREPALTALRHELRGWLAARGGVLTADELVEVVLAERGSAAEEPKRRSEARAVVRAALETEAGLLHPGWLERRRGSLLLVAREAEEGSGEPRAAALADWAERLGEEAGRLSRRDPLPSPAAVVTALERVKAPPELAPLPPARLVRLAAALSPEAACSSRLEIYPRGLAPERALRLAAGSFAGARQLSREELAERLRARFPEAAPLPPTSTLDALLAPYGFTWNPLECTYQSLRTGSGLASSATLSRATASATPAQTPDEFAAQELEARLTRAVRSGAFLLLGATHRDLVAAERRLITRFGLEALSCDALLLAALRRAAQRLEIDWGVVLAADAAPAGSADHQNLRRLVAEALPDLEAEITARSGTVLLTYPGLLARYDRLDLLERLRDRLATPAASNTGLKGLWVLYASDAQSTAPRIDGKAVPVLTTNEYATLPSGWPEATG